MVYYYRNRTLILLHGEVLLIKGKPNKIIICKNVTCMYFESGNENYLSIIILLHNCVIYQNSFIFKLRKITYQRVQVHW